MSFLTKRARASEYIYTYIRTQRTPLSLEKCNCIQTKQQLKRLKNYHAQHSQKERERENSPIFNPQKKPFTSITLVLSSKRTPTNDGDKDDDKDDDDDALVVVSFETTTKGFGAALRGFLDNCRRRRRKRRVKKYDQEDKEVKEEEDQTASRSRARKKNLPLLHARSEHHPAPGDEIEERLARDSTFYGAGKNDFSDDGRGRRGGGSRALALREDRERRRRGGYDDFDAEN